jgi:hypothetical protein
VTTYDCMTPDELALWLAMAVRGGGKTPCVDCPLWFQQEAIAAGLCIRAPGWNPGGGRHREVSMDPAIARQRMKWRDAKRRQTARRLARARAVERTKAWKEQLRRDVAAVRATWDNGAAGTGSHIADAAPLPVPSGAASLRIGLE